MERMKVLFTIVDRGHGIALSRLYEQNDVGLHMQIIAEGTATSEILDMLGLNNNKAVVISVIREDLTDTIMKVLEEKFSTIRNGKGIAFAVPLSSVIGVNIYRFLSNNQM